MNTCTCGHHDRDHLEGTGLCTVKNLPFPEFCTCTGFHDMAKLTVDPPFGNSDRNAFVRYRSTPTGDLLVAFASTAPQEPPVSHHEVVHTANATRITVDGYQRHEYFPGGDYGYLVPVHSMTVEMATAAGRHPVELPITKEFYDAISRAAAANPSVATHLDVTITIAVDLPEEPA